MKYAAWIVVVTAVALPGPAWAVQDVRAHADGGVALEGGGVDVTPPGIPVLTLQAGPGTIRVSWIAPGDDGFTGQARDYDLRYRAEDAFTPRQWNDAGTIQVTGEPVPAPAGTPESMDVPVVGNETYTFILKTSDAAGNSSMSASATISLDSTPPGQVASIEALASTQNSIVLSWSATGDDGSQGSAAEYKLHWTDRPFVPGDEAALIAHASTWHQSVLPTQISGYAVTGLEEATAYFFTVQGLDENGNVGAPAALVTASTGGHRGVEAGGSNSVEGCQGSAVGAAALLALAGALLFLRIRMA